MKCLNAFWHIMNPDELYALRRGECDKGKRPTEPIIRRRFIRKRTDQPFAARTQHDRAAKAVKQAKSVDQRQIMLERFAEADPWIDDNPIARDTGLDKRINPRV